MNTPTISPRAPMLHHLPAVALLGLLLILTFSHIYLQQAFPLHGVGLSAGVALLATCLALAPARRGETRRRPGWLLAAYGLQIGWAAWGGVELARAPVAAFGRAEFTNTLLGLMVFLIVAESAWRWRELPLLRDAASRSPDLTDQTSPTGQTDQTRPSGLSPASDSARPQVLFPEQIVGVWFCAMAVALSAFALYQVYGPAGWPRTFATLRDLIGGMSAVDPAADPTLEGTLHALREGRAFATFGAPNMFAGFLVPGLALLAGWTFAAGRRAGRIAAGLGLLLALWALVLSQSRGGMLAAMAAIGWLALRAALAARSDRSGTSDPSDPSVPSDLSAKTAASLVVLAVAALAFAAGPLRAQPRPDGDGRREAGRATSATVASAAQSTPKPTFQQHLLASTTVRQRLYYWHTALSVWGQNPALGGGLGAYEVFYPSLRRPGAGETLYAHNWLFQFGAETGAVGVALFVAATLAAVVLGRRAARGAGGRSGAERLRMFAVEGAVVGLFLHGLADYTFSLRELVMDAQMLLGLMAGCGAMAISDETAVRDRGGATAARAAAAWAARLALVAAAWVLLAREGWAPMAARFWSTAARDRILETGHAAEARDLAIKALAWEPDDPWNLADLAGAELDGGNPVRALDLLRRAASIHPRSASIQASIAGAYDALGKPEEAFRAARRAVELHPLAPRHRIELAERLLARGDLAGAREQLAAARQVPLTPILNRRLRDVERRMGQ